MPLSRRVTHLGIMAVIKTLIIMSFNAIEGIKRKEEINILFSGCEEGNKISHLK